MADEALDGGGVKEVGIEFKTAFETALVPALVPTEPYLALPQGQGQIELRRWRRCQPRFEFEPRQFQQTERLVLQSEDDLHDRLLTEAPARREFLHQTLEGQLLMGHRAQRRLARQDQQRLEIGLGIDLHGDRQGVDEEADQPLQFEPLTPGRR